MVKELTASVRHPRVECWLPTGGRVGSGETIA
jgi:hypothetical protein